MSSTTPAPTLFERYLAVLGVRAQHPSLDALAELTAAHLARIPFENVSKLHAFGSRAREAYAHVVYRHPFSAHSSSDLDLAALPEPGRVWTADDRVRLVLALEEVFPVGHAPLDCRPRRPCRFLDLTG